MQHRLNRADAHGNCQRLVGTHLCFDLALQSQQLVGINQKARTRRGQFELLGSPVKQQHSQLLFKCGDTAGHGRLR